MINKITFIWPIVTLGLAGLLIYSALPTAKLKERNPPQSVLSAVVLPLPTETVPSLESVQAVRVIDGDTTEVNLKGQLEKVRYLGINTPETVDPRRKVQCFGHEASNKNKELVEGKQVQLEGDIENRDKYNRLLRYVYLKVDEKNLLFINDYLVREGYAQV